MLEHSVDCDVDIQEELLIDGHRLEISYGNLEESHNEWAKNPIQIAVWGAEVVYLVATNLVI